MAARKTKTGRTSKAKVGSSTTRSKTARTRKRSAKKKPAPRKTAGAAKRGARQPAPDAASAFPEVVGLVRLMEEHGLVELEYRSEPDGTREVRLARAVAGGGAPALISAAPGAVTPAAQVEATSGPAGADAVDDGVVAFTSPMVGTFYRAQSPEAEPYVSVGDTVDAGSTLICIIEAMKVMNEITPDVSGAVVSIEVENGEAVEFGQTLFLIRPR